MLIIRSPFKIMVFIYFSYGLSKDFCGEQIFLWYYLYLIKTDSLLLMQCEIPAS